jgi:hypothetical protein
MAQQADSVFVKPVHMGADSTTLRAFGGVVVSTDSLLRWQQWGGFDEWAARQPWLTARGLGGYGRNAGISSSPLFINTDRVRWNGVIINNPLSGQFNSAEIPFDQSFDIVHYSNGLSEFVINPQTYAVIKPLTVIRYEQSSYEYRNLDGMLAMPLSEKWMVQASYNGQKDDGKYTRSNFVGRRSTGNVQYALHRKWTSNAFWLYQGAEMDESMGYQFSDASTFSFDRFRAQAKSGNSTSMRRYLLVGLNLKPHESADGVGLTLYRSLYRNEWRAGDTTTIRAQEWGIAAKYGITAGGGINLQPYMDLAFISDYTGDVQLEGDVTSSAYNVGIRGTFSPIRRIDLLVHGETSRTLSGTGTLLDVAGQVKLPIWANVTVGYVVASVATPPMYTARLPFYASNGYIPDAIEETAWYVNVIKPAGVWRYRLNARSSKSLTVPAVGSDESILPMSVDRLAVFVGMVERHSDNHEIMLGFNSSHIKVPDGIDGLSNEQRFISSAFWKGYVFDKAAYMKGGAVFSTALSNTRSMAYLPELGIWLPNADGSVIPAHHRLDIEFAARVRSMILTGRIENTLDGWTQKGYFQTLPYPMPGRRLRIGLKVHFRD